MLLSYLTGGLDLQRSKRSLEIWDVGLEFVKSSRDVGLKLGWVSSRRAVECNLVKCLRHVGDESRIVRRTSCNVLVDEFKVTVAKSVWPQPQSWQ